MEVERATGLNKKRHWNKKTVTWRQIIKSQNWKRESENYGITHRIGGGGIKKRRWDWWQLASDKWSLLRILIRLNNAIATLQTSLPFFRRGKVLPHSSKQLLRAGGKPWFAFFKLRHCWRWWMCDGHEQAFNFSFGALQMDAVLLFN